MYNVTSATEPSNGPRKYAPRLPVEARREQLLDSALRVLARDGYDKVSIEAIANEAGVTRPVVYGAYDGLEPLLHALLDRTQQRALAQVLGVLAQAGNPSDIDQWVLDAAGYFIDQMRADPDVWRPILSLTSGAPRIVTERIAGTRETIRKFIAGALAAGIEMRGGPFVDPELLAHLVVATGEEYGRLMLEEPPRYSRERVLSALEGLLAALPRPRH